MPNERPFRFIQIHSDSVANKGLCASRPTQLDERRATFIHSFVRSLAKHGLHFKEREPERLMRRRSDCTRKRHAIRMLNGSEWEGSTLSGEFIKSGKALRVLFWNFFSFSPSVCVAVRREWGRECGGQDQRLVSLVSTSDTRSSSGFNRSSSLSLSECVGVFAHTTR